MELYLMIKLLWAPVLLVWIITGWKSKQTEKREPDRHRILHLFALLAAFGLTLMEWQAPAFLRIRLIPDQALWHFTGIGLSVISLGFAIWARLNLGDNWSGRITLKQEHRLITTGAYAVTRHPIYTGLLFGLLGNAVTIGELKGFIGFAILFIAYVVKSRKEEQLLIGHFGVEYLAFKVNRKALIPFIW